MLALIQGGSFVREIISNSRFDIDAITVMPAHAGWTYGEYSLHEIRPAAPLPVGMISIGTTVALVGDVWTYVHTLEAELVPTPQELRANMPQLSMVDFRRKLRGIKVIQRLDENGTPEAGLDGIYEADILEKIDLIADKELAAEARDYFLYAQYIERINPWIEILGSMFDIAPEEIDTFWTA